MTTNYTTPLCQSCTAPKGSPHLSICPLGIAEARNRVTTKIKIAKIVTLLLGIMAVAWLILCIISGQFSLAILVLAIASLAFGLSLGIDLGQGVWSRD